MTAIGFIGLGIMRSHLAANLVRAGHSITGYDVVPAAVDGERGLEVLAGGLAGNRILDLKAAGMPAREFEPGFRIDLHHKDMGIALASARAAGVALRVTGVAQLVAAARPRTRIPRPLRPSQGRRAALGPLITSGVAQCCPGPPARSPQRPGCGGAPPPGSH
ncbi:NAD-binding protein [Kribbella capetownensis]|uniref:NAD-binding protein n=1 Tax=Kribbella capetownensis TaxID=1572659 RepID=UPI001EDDD57F|nr:NAD-binding protein [Kribbella capetownensis]